MSSSIGSEAFQLAFQCSPIFLVGGAATSIPGGMLPVLALTEAPSFVAGLLSGASTPSLDDYFAQFVPLPGSTLIDNQIGTYPFANQAVAANAIIAQPLTLSMLMICPARGALGYATKLATMIALQAVLANHCAQGGTFTVLTPSYIFTNMILLTLRDASRGQSKQRQDAWQWDFVAPLLTLNAAQSVQSSLMGKLTSGSPIDGQPTWSGLSSGTPGVNAAQTPNVIPSAGGTASGITSPSQSFNYGYM
jgi:hypothetical protein